MLSWILVITGIACNAAASIMMKIGAAQAAKASAAGLMGLITNFWLYGAVASYGAAFVLYGAALSRMPLNVAHPIMTAGAIVLVGLSSAFYFRESVSVPTVIGYSLLLAGIVALAFAPKA
jgi:multidrug transporter EmrE-like cation transporter